MDIRIRACLVFDEVYDWDTVIKELADRNINAQKEIINAEGKDFEVLMIDGGLADMIKLKLDWNCMAHPENEYIWYPMASYEEKLKAQAMLRDR